MEEPIVDDYVTRAIIIKPTNFEQYTAVMLTFITDVIPRSAGHAGPLEPESNIIKNELYNLNRLDCVTVNSQPYEEFTDDDENIYRQRPFVSLFYPRRKINQLMQLLKNEPMLITVYAPGTGVISYNPILYDDMAGDSGYIPLVQQKENDIWVDARDGDSIFFNKEYMEEMFMELQWTNDDMYVYGYQNLVMVEIIGLNFDNEMFNQLERAAHTLFFD